MNTVIKAMGQNWLIFLGLLAFSMVLRFLPHPANFSAMTAVMFLAPMAVKPRLLAAAVAILATYLTDLKLGIYPGISFVYFSYGFIALLGFFQAYLNKTSSSSVQKWFGAAVNVLAGATGFFVISNIGVWLYGGLYARTFEGFIECFVLAIPFFHQTLWSHILFSVSLSVMFVLLNLALRARGRTRVY